jgi:copper resistance protein B
MSNRRLRTLAVAISVALAGTAAPHTAFAQHEGHTAPAAATEAAPHADHSTHTQAPQHSEHAGHAAPTSDVVPPPTDADRAAAFPTLDASHMLHEMHDDPLNKAVLVDRLERHDIANGNLTTWDVDAWIGRSLSKLWVRTEGERFSGSTERAELELLWGKSFARWWDLVAGARHDFEPGPSRDWAAVGVRGLAPYRFDVAATAYFGDGGRTALRAETSYEILVTNKWILQPLLELNWYGQSDRNRDIGAGLADAELGLRLRYEIRREVAPYVGLIRETKLGATADFARARGADVDDARLVAGVRLSF